MINIWIPLCRFTAEGILGWWDFFDLVLRLELVMGIPLTRRCDIFYRHINWPYRDWNLLLNFWLLVGTLLCMNFFWRHVLARRPLLLMRQKRLWYLRHVLTRRRGRLWHRLWHLMHVLARRQGRMWHLRQVVVMR